MPCKETGNHTHIFISQTIVSFPVSPFFPLRWLVTKTGEQCTCTSQDVGFILWLLVSLVLFLSTYSFHEHESNKKIRDNIESCVSRVCTNVVLRFHIPYTLPFEQVGCLSSFNKQGYRETIINWYFLQHFKTECRITDSLCYEMI